MSKKNRKPWRASQQRQQESGADTQGDQRKPDTDEAVRAIPPHQLKGMARREWIDAQALEMYEREVSLDLNVHFRSCVLTAEAFESQMKAGKGVDEDKAWGPDVSPYEARMTGSLLARLMREKRTWLRDCRQRIEQALAEDATAEETLPGAGPEPAADDTPEPTPTTHGAQFEAGMTACAPADGALALSGHETS